ncbi:MAG: GNAT family N-acetyltransferase [Spirochaetaceae bacterium]|nr:GNAT family N-acetyltransferase [Spirochaetaceae bacterium]
MEIKKMELKDLKEVVKIYKDVVKNMIANNVFQWDETYPNEDILKEDILKEQMFAGMLNNEIASIFVLNKEFDNEYLKTKWEYKNDDFIVLHRICVKVNFQNKGVGTKTMKMIEEKMKIDGIKSIRLDAFSENPYSLKMYNKLGYKKVGEVSWRNGLFCFFEKII